jgi:hypothetical protein
VQPFPATGAKYQIAMAGNNPAWSADGRRLYYVINGQQLVVVPVTTQPTFSFGSREAVPGSERLNLPGGLTTERQYDVAPDGSIIGTVDAEQDAAGAATAPQIVVVLNWFEELKSRVPTK